MGNDDDRFGEVLEFFPAFANQMPQQAAFDIVNIGYAFGNIGIAGAGKVFGNIPQGDADGVLGGIILFGEQIADLAAEAFIPEKMEVYREEVLDFAVPQLGLGALQVGDFLGGVQEGLAEPLFFQADLLGGDRAARDAVGFRFNNYGGVDAYAGGYAYAFQDFHDYPISNFSFWIKRARASMAWGASSPSAISFSLVPWVAASMVTCIMLFPSTHWVFLQMLMRARKRLAQSTICMAGRIWRPSGFRISTSRSR